MCIRKPERKMNVEKFALQSRGKVIEVQFNVALKAEVRVSRCGSSPLVLGLESVGV